MWEAWEERESCGTILLCLDVCDQALLVCCDQCVHLARDQPKTREIGWCVGDVWDNAEEELGWERIERLGACHCMRSMIARDSAHTMPDEMFDLFLW